MGLLSTTILGNHHIKTFETVIQHDLHRSTTSERSRRLRNPLNRGGIQGRSRIYHLSPPPKKKSVTGDTKLFPWKTEKATKKMGIYFRKVSWYQLYFPNPQQKPCFCWLTEVIYPPTLRNSGELGPVPSGVTGSLEIRWRLGGYDLKGCWGVRLRNRKGSIEVQIHMIYIYILFSNLQDIQYIWYMYLHIYPK